MRKNSKFSDSFSSILVDLFDVTKDKTEYRSLFRNGLEDAKHLTSQEFGTELIDESRISLGMGDNYSAFWSAVYKCFDKTFDGQDIEDDLELGTDIRTLNHDNLNSDNNIKILSSLFDELDVSVGAFNSQSFVKIDLTEYHFEKLKSKIFKLFKPFKVKSRERLIDSEIDERQKLLQIWFDFENCDTEIKNFANEKREDFTPDYQSFVNDYLSKFDLNIRNIEDYNYKDLYLDKIYETNLKEFDERERQQIIQDQELKSLLYYEDNLDYLYNILREKSQEDKKQSQADKSLNSDKEISDDKIKTIRGKKLSSGKSQKKSGRKKPYQPNNNDTENKNIGDRCEVWAKEELEKKFGIDFVDHVSKRDEGKHYDIRYSPDEGKSWKYVEVKNYAKSRFVLTQDEKKFGNKYSKNYEFHLVDLNNDIIYVAEDPYNTSDLHFEEKEYWVYYQLSDHKKA